ncbi:CWC16 protein [Phyllosticta citribraziliensis]|uniref:CWC16 protein n=1 Tax=Phyllosticta citribraziliensis TaxID=989973 RepID=A0ABR1LIE4_9PEZI
MQGFNMGRYYAPSTSSPPRFNTSSHPLGQRARKINQGILTVRFEMPFAVWCTTCDPENIIGQGVRFNAEKQRVGKYHSTPIWEFRMRHGACGGTIAIRTDPQNSEYVVTEGARRRDTGSKELYQHDVKDGLFEIVTAEEKERRRQDAFAAFEGKKTEAEQGKMEERRIEELKAWREKDWADPYAANKRLRRPFREARKEREKDDEFKEGLQEKYGLGFDIVDGREEDAERAKMIEFGRDEDEGDFLGVAKRPLFDTTSREPSQPKSRGKTKAAQSIERSKKALQQTLEGNTRAALDPFLSEKPRSTTHIIAGIKRRRADADDADGSRSLDGQTEKMSPIPASISRTSVTTLVAYASDDD